MVRKAPDSACGRRVCYPQHGTIRPWRRLISSRPPGPTRIECRCRWIPCQCFHDRPPDPAHPYPVHPDPARPSIPSVQRRASRNGSRRALKRRSYRPYRTRYPLLSQQPHPPHRFTHRATGRSDCSHNDIESRSTESTAVVCRPGSIRVAVPPPEQVGGRAHVKVVQRAVPAVRPST